MRFTYNFLALGVLGAVVAWADRAPADPIARAAYLCTPVHAVARAVIVLQDALAGDGAREPAIDPWRFNPGLSCERLVLRFELTQA